MIARSSTASFENVKRIGMCIIGGGRDMSMRTLMCHSPERSATEVVLIEKFPAAQALAVEVSRAREETAASRRVLADMTSARYLVFPAARTMHSR